MNVCVLTVLEVRGPRRLRGGQLHIERSPPSAEDVVMLDLEPAKGIETRDSQINVEEAVVRLW